METKIYNKSDLSEFIHSEQFRTLEKIPISYHRALSHLNNPRCAESDVILVVQYDQHSLAGYLGVLPDYLYDQNEPRKIGWLSCFWVDEAYRSKPVAAALLLHVMESWDHRILITNFVPSLATLYLKTGFFHPSKNRYGVRAYLRSNLNEILPPKSKIFRRLLPLLKVMDFSVNIIGDIRFLYLSGNRVAELQLKFFEEIDDDVSGFINARNNNLSRRGKNELRWILDYPWIKEQTSPDKESERYYFSSVSRRFFYRLVRLNNNQGMISAIFLVCIRNNSMTVPYLYADEASLDAVSRELLNVMKAFKVSMITVFNEDLGKAIMKQRHSFLFTKPIKKPFLISKKIDLSNLDFQDGDGDCVFY